MFVVFQSLLIAGWFPLSLVSCYIHKSLASQGWFMPLVPFWWWFSSIPTRHHVAVPPGAENGRIRVARCWNWHQGVGGWRIVCWGNIWKTWLMIIYLRLYLQHGKNIVNLENHLFATVVNLWFYTGRRIEISIYIYHIFVAKMTGCSSREQGRFAWGKSRDFLWTTSGWLPR